MPDPSNPDPSKTEGESPRPRADAPAAAPIFNVPPLVVALVACLVAIHLLGEVLGEDFEIWTLYALSFIPQRLAGVEIAAPAGSQIWTFLTYALLHGSWLHLLSNSLWLVVFATPVTRRLGTVRALLLLCVSAVAGAFSMLPLHWGDFLIVVGASASVSGAMAAAMPIMYAKGFRGGRTPLEDLVPLGISGLVHNRSAIAFTAVFFLLQLFTGASQATTGTALLTENVIAWEAHLGGFVAGLVAFYFLDRQRPSHQPRM